MFRSNVPTEGRRYNAQGPAFTHRIIPSENDTPLYSPRSSFPSQSLARPSIGPERDHFIFRTLRDQKRLTVTAFDPIRGRGKLLRILEKDPNEGMRVALSPDGSTLAAAKNNHLEIHVRLLPLSGGSGGDIVVQGWLNLAGLDWSADGKGIYVGSTSSQGGTLLYVDLKGAAQVVWQNKENTRFLGGIASPDGRHLAIWGAMHNSTAWMVEGF
jgi:hypothetical protein